MSPARGRLKIMVGQLVASACDAIEEAKLSAQQMEWAQAYLREALRRLGRMEGMLEGDSLLRGAQWVQDDALAGVYADLAQMNRLMGRIEGRLGNGGNGGL